MTELTRTVRRAVIVGVAALAVGCSFIPRYQRPVAPVAERFPVAPGTAPLAADARRVVDIAWQDFFGDPRLKRLIGIALDNNRDLRLAALNIDQARAVFRIRRADELPTLAGTGAVTRQHTPATVSLLQRETTINTYQVGLGISAFELDFFGRLRSLSEQALAQYFATEEARRTTQISLISSVANLHLAIVSDDEQLALVRQTLESREETLRLSKMRFDAGVSSELDLRQAETLVEAARASQAQLARQRALDENALVLLLGQPLAPDLPPARPLAAQGLLADVPVGLPSDLLVNRPDIRGAEQSLIAANANIGAARAAFFPRISLTGSAGLASTDLSTLLRGSSLAWSLAPSASLPIFDAGRNESNLELAKLQRESAVAQYERTIQTAFREVGDALSSRGTYAEQLVALQAQSRAEQARLRLSELRYKGGVATFLDLLDAQRSLFAVQQAVIQTLASQLQSQVTLYRSLGGGWSEQPSVSALNGERSLSSSR